MTSKSKMLKQMLYSPNLEFAMECHSGLSAVIAEEAGFKCLWASGLSMSAMTGCRDRNELDISEVCKIVEWMADHTTIPILVDGDTGGVDPNSARIMVSKLTKAGAAGVCIEDKLYPKHNSFLDNSSSDLADPALHSTKIREMKAENPDFVVVARLESFIAGRDVTDAIRRARMYQLAGADAILVHSKINTCDEIKAFMERWNTFDDRIPVVIVPTKYYTTPTEEFRTCGVSLVIWANHQLRASIRAMQSVAQTIYRDKSLVNVESEIATVSEVFRLQRDEELARKEAEYPVERSSTAIILSAANYSGTFLPKCFAPVFQHRILDYLLEGLKQESVRTSYLVLGSGGNVDRQISEGYDYKINTQIVDNDEWETSTEVLSLNKGLSAIKVTDPFPIFVVYGDLVFKNQIFSRLRLVPDADIVIGIDPKDNPSKYNEYVIGDRPHCSDNLSSTTNIGDVCDYRPTKGSVGSFVGVFVINTVKGFDALQTCTIQTLIHNPKKRLCDVLHRLSNMPGIRVKGTYVTSDEWIDVNTADDIKTGEVTLVDFN